MSPTTTGGSSTSKPRYGIRDEQLWSKRNYLVWDEAQGRKVWARQPFYIEHRATAGMPLLVRPLFTQAQVRWVVERMLYFIEVVPDHYRRVLNIEAAMARSFDNRDSWPEDQSRNSSLIALSIESGFQLGQAVADILEWHGVLVDGTDIDQDALELWQVAATLLAEPL